MSVVRDLWLLLMHYLLNGHSAKARYFSTSCSLTRGMSVARFQKGRKEGRKSLFGKVYINWWYLQYNNFSLGDHTKTAVRSLS